MTVLARAVGGVVGAHVLFLYVFSLVLLVLLVSLGRVADAVVPPSVAVHVVVAGTHPRFVALARV